VHKMHQFSFKHTPALLLTSCNIHSNTAGKEGTVFLAAYPLARIEYCNIHNNTARQGGGIYVYFGNLEIIGTTIANNRARISGGGIYLWDGTTSMSSNSFIIDNYAPYGRSYVLQAAKLQYSIPLPAGYWLPISKCLILRESCPLVEGGSRARTECIETFDECRSTPDAVDGTPPQVNGWSCTNRIQTLQTCDWVNNPGRLGTENFESVPGPQNQDFPYACAAGLIGSADPEFQKTPSCRGPCPAGKLCPNPATVSPTDCPVGAYCPAGSTLPSACPAGRYSNETGLSDADSCKPCPPGASCVAGSVQPVVCAWGSVATAEGSAECAPCPAGTFTRKVGGIECTACPEGYFCPLGASQPLPCLAGRFSNRTRLVDSDSCESTPAGYFSAAAATESQPCPSGSYSSGKAPSACAECEGGKFQPGTGQTACLECTPGLYCPPGSPNPLGCESGASLPNAQTTGLMADSPDNCVCQAGYYDAGSNISGLVCRTCPSGSVCPSPGATLYTLPILPGYYRPHRRSVDVRKCVDAFRNCSGDLVCPTSTSGCTGTVGENSDRGNGCNDGLDGVYCLLCAKRRESLYYYIPATDSKRAHCRECDNAAELWIVAVASAAVGALAVGAALMKLYRAYMVGVTRRATLARAWRILSPHVKLKILVGFYLIASVLDKVYEVELPATAKRLFELFHIGITLGFDTGLGALLECFGMGGYISRLAVYMVMPATLSLLILLVGVVYLRRSFSWVSLLELTGPSLMQLFFFVYPIVTRLAFGAFSCYEFEEGQWLKEDVSIRCFSDRHRSAQLLASLAIVIYPIGLLLLNSSLLFFARHAILHGHHTPLSRAIAFLYRDYEVHMFWWEAVEMVRRFVLVGLMVLMQGTMVQLAVGIFLSAAFLLLQLLARPYKNWADDLIASVASFSLLLVLVCLNHFKYTALTNLERMQEKMSNEQKAVYIIDIDLFVVIVIAGLTATLAFSMAIFAWEVSVEAWGVKLLDSDSLRICTQKMAEESSREKKSRMTRDKLSSKLFSISIGRSKLVVHGSSRQQSGVMSNNKFTVNTLITGNAEDAARGLPYFMGVSDPFGVALGGVQKIEAEVTRLACALRAMEDDAADARPYLGFAATGGAYAEKSASIVGAIASELEDWLHYVIHQASSEKEFHNGVRDLGRNQMALCDFVAQEAAVQAQLEPAHVVALRFYTTHAFKYMNGPLRSQEFGQGKRPHPLPITMAFLSEAIKKLRAVHASRPEATTEMCLWRGMRNLGLAGEFMDELRGGTEVSPMSTTSDIRVAARYGISDCSLLFKIKVNNFVQYGAELGWVSAFPAEAEVCYPPLTYLQPTGAMQVVKVINKQLTVCEVVPHIP